MAGISVPQYEIFKIGTNKLKYSNWNLTITKKEAFRYQELVSLFEAQNFRIIAEKILHKSIDKIDFSKIFLIFFKTSILECISLMLIIFLLLSNFGLSKI